MWFYVDKNREQQGPVSVDEIKRLLQAGEITKRSYLWQDGRADWVRLEALAAELGIVIAAPPPTPQATMVMQKLPVQPAPIPVPVMAPPGMAPPVMVPPQQMPPPQFSQSPLQDINYSAAPQAPSFPQQQVPVYANQPASAGGGGGIGKLLTALIALGGLSYYGYQNFGHLVPVLSDHLASAALEQAMDDLQPARAEIEVVFKSKDTCPGQDLELKAKVNSQLFPDFNYGTTGNEQECQVFADLPKDLKHKAIAGTRVLFVLKDGKWLCGMSAKEKYRPKVCDEIEIE
jgi:GYF domain 2